MKFFFLLWFFFIFCSVWAVDTDVKVTNTNDSGVGSLRDAITTINGAGVGNHTITFDAGTGGGIVNLASSLPVIDNSSATSITITGPTSKVGINGNSSHPAFFIFSGTSISISDVDIFSAKAKGGNGSDGGGGGAGAGSAIFVHSGNTLTIQNMDFDGNAALGGNGGSGVASQAGGGGGGMGGNGAIGSSISPSGGGGGGGLIAVGAAGSNTGGGGGGGCLFAGGAAAGGGGGGSGTSGAGGAAVGNTGGSAGTGGGGAGGDGSDTVAGTAGAAGTASGGAGGGGGKGATDGGAGGAGGNFGGGGGGGAGHNNAGVGGNGGFAGGGGGGGERNNANGGVGGFGGGGGAGGTPGDATGGGIGGNAGYGGGGGGARSSNSVVAGGTSNNHGGSGGQTAGIGLSSGGGGGGAALGGAVFTENGATLIIKDRITFGSTTANTVTKGTGAVGAGGGSSGTDGDQKGANLWRMEGGNVTVDLTSNVNLSAFEGDITGKGGLTKNGTATLFLSGANIDNGGTTTVNAGTLDISGISAPDLTMRDLSGTAGTVALGTKKLIVSSSNPTTYFGDISGTGANALDKTGSATFTLAGTQKTFSGNTAISGGTLQLGAVDILPTATDVTLSGGSTFSLNSNNQTIGLLTSSDPTTVVSLGAGALTTGKTAIDSTAASQITGTGGITKANSGKLTLTSTTSNYSGATTLSGGILSIGASTNLGTSGITFNGGTLEITGSPTLTRPLTLTSTGNIAVTTGNTATVSGTISGASGLDKLDVGTLIIGGLTKTYTGNTTINGGTLQLGAANILPTATDVTLSGGSTFSLNSNNQTIGLLTSSDPTTVVSLGAGTLTTGKTAIDSTAASQITGTGGITKANSGKLTLTSTTSNYSGATTLSGGILSIGASTNLGNTSSINFNGGTLDVTGNPTLANPMTFNNISQFSITSGNSAIISGPLSGAGGLDKQSSGKLTLTSTTSNYTGMTNLIGGTLSISDSTNLGNTSGIVFNGGTLEITGNSVLSQPMTLASTGNVGVSTGSTVTISGSVSGISGLNKQDSGTLVIEGAAKTYSGNTIITSGTLRMNAPNVLPSSTNMNVSTGAIFDLNNEVAEVSVLSGAGVIQIGSGGLTVNASAPSSFSGLISGTGLLANQGGGDLILSGNNTFSGLITNASGTQLIGNCKSITSDVVNAGTLVIDETIGGVFANTISGSGTFRKEGSEKLTLTGANSQTSSIALTGELSVNGSLLGALTIEPGAMLTGNGILEDVTVKGTIFPGNSIDTIFVADLTFSTGATHEAEIDPNTADLISASGTVTIEPGVTLKVISLPGAYDPAQNYTLIEAASLIGTFDNVILSPPRYDYSLVYSSSQLELFVQLISFYPLVHGHNARAVARCFDQLEAIDNPDLDNLVAAFGASDSKQLIHNFNQMQPSLFNGLAITQEDRLIAVRNVISERLSEYRRAHYCCEDIYCCDLYKFWVAPFGIWTGQKSQSGQLGFCSKGWGVIAGLDRRFCEQDYFGASIGYSFTDVDYSKSKSDGDIESLHAALYAHFERNCWFLDLIADGAWGEICAMREMDFKSPEKISDRHAKHDNDTYEIDLYVGGGATFCLCSFGITPFFGFDWIYLNQDSYKESGARALNLRVKSKSYTMLRAEAGIEASAIFCICDEWFGVFEGGFSYVREERFKGKSTKASFRELDSCQFTVDGLNPSRNLIIPSIGFAIDQCCGKFVFSGHYEIELGYRDGGFGNKYRSQNINFRLGYRF